MMVIGNCQDEIEENERLMKNPAVARISIAPNLLLDGRLALFHEVERWLAVADLHFGYELSQRRAGRLVPLWGMQSIEERLTELLREYQPRQLIIAGDLVHDRASVDAATSLLARLRCYCEVIALAGNHDRKIAAVIRFMPRWETPEFVLHHGDCAIEKAGRIQIIGHHHPAASVRDGAGLRLKCPALIQQTGCWILPAFSPWAGGVVWPDDGASRIWLCTPRRVLRVDRNYAVPTCDSGNSTVQ
ncbi:MAG TPA: metallophosphoesterase [Chthoniobacterales bacterium]|jgi:putative SbcD/Mre11-related phosphoesterase|nr:metallophosphoesterase [Chthoniobacterales bacterium]